MSKCHVPSFEQLPYYMSVMGMQGARFFEGNDGAGAGGTDPGKTPEGTKPGEDKGKQPEGEKPAEGKPGEDDFKSKESKDAVMADLFQEREDRKKFQAEVATLTTQAETLSTTIATHESTISERDATIAARETEISVLNLALQHGISEKSDLELLREIPDASKRESLAARLARAAGRSAPVPQSGTGSGEDLKGGSIAERRREIKARKNK